MSLPAPSRPMWWRTPAYAACVGREREQQAMQAALNQALAGAGRLVLVAGEAGIGKSTLVGDVVGRAANSGALALTGASDDLTTAAPYAPWLALWRGYPPAADDLPLLPAALASVAAMAALGSQEALFDVVTNFVQAVAARRPLTLVLEDIHWADPASLDLVRHLGRVAASQRLLLIATYRDDDIVPRHPLFRLLPALVREAHAERIDVRPFDETETRALVASRYALAPVDEARLVAYIQARGDGNPFFLDEMLRTLEAGRLLTPTAGGWRLGNLHQAPVPALVRQVIEGRLAALDDATRMLLEVAAVIGQEVPLDLWRAVSDTSTSQVEAVVQQALDAHILCDAPDLTVARFRHALVRDTLYDGQPLARRRATHGRVADRLATRPEPPASTVAAHFAAAGDPRAIDWSVRAGEQALAVYAATEAIVALDRAQTLAARYGRELPLSAFRARAAAHAMSGAFDAARRDFEAVLTRARTLGDQRAEVQALLDLSLQWAERDYELCGDYCRAALAVARRGGDGLLIAHSLNRLGNWHANHDEPTLALPLHQEALALFEMAGDERGIADTLDHLGLTSFFGCDMAQGAIHCERAITLWRRLGDQQRLSNCLAVLACGGFSGDLDLVGSGVVGREPAYWRACADEAVAIARAIGWPAGEAFALHCLAAVALAQGDLGGAWRATQAGLAVARQIGHQQWTVALQVMYGLVRAELGDARSGAARLEEALALARRTGSGFWVGTTTVLLARLRVSLGELATAQALLDQVTSPDWPRPTVADRHAWYVLAMLTLASGHPARCQERLDALIRHGPASAPPARLPRVQLLRAQALAQLGRVADAEAAYQSARATAAAAGFQLLLWQIEVALAHLYQLQGRASEAAGAAGAARTTILAIAATIEDIADRARFEAKMMAQVPDPTTTLVGAAASSLSPRELEVLRLIADGKTDREIAADLAISHRTVMRHVTGILNKLGVSTRTAAATLALRQRIV